MSQLLAVKIPTASRPVGEPALDPVWPTRFTRTVPKEFVHRAAVAEVLLTSWTRLDDTHFSVTAQWPRGHSYYTSADGVHHDPMLVAETIRQCGSLLSHAEFGVPLDHHFLVSELTYSVELEQVVLAEVPADLELFVSCHDVKMRGGKPARMAYEVELRRDGRLVGSGGAQFTCSNPAVYRRLRGDRLGCRSSAALPEAAPAWSVGRQDAADVVLSAADRARGMWRLRADTRHPILFDHPTDHIPGMVLIEAARQAACTLYPAFVAPSAVRASFYRIVEFDRPCWVEAEQDGGCPAGGSVVHVTALQDDEVVFSCSVSAPALR